MKESPCKETLSKQCSNCGSKMEKGRLQTGGRGVSRVYLETEGSDNNQLSYFPVCTWYCRNCGKILLFADVTTQDPNPSE